MATGTFIGIEALEQIAIKYTQKAAMSGAYYRPDVFERLGIEVISGIQFKSIKNVVIRKGHTAIRKEVGVTHRSQAGYTIEREMVCRLAWDFFVDNKDNYIEKAIVTMDGGVQNVSYPNSELAVQAILTNYGENLFDCLWFGDDTISKTATNKYLRLYTGFITNLNRDITAGNISTAKKNLVTSSDIDYPAGPTDTGAWKVFLAFYNQWSQSLKNNPDVRVYMNGKTAMAIAKAFANDYGNNDGVKYQDNGNYKFPLWPNITICPESSMGTGDKMIATVAKNFEYGVDSLSNQNQLSVRLGSDNDHNDISWQIQSVQGTRVLRVEPSVFCMTNGSLAAISEAGDYTANVCVVTSADTTLGTVKVNDSATIDNTKDYPAGTILTLKAEPATNKTFKQWSNGATDAEITIVTTGMPEAYTAFFE